ncbi:MAG TPA: DNA methyltransferase [Anaerolineae bacterium]|nr:DNA methyltransferase [Anaerolineae bacterium]
MPTTLTPQEFVNKWRGSTSTERQAYQQHFIDLCHLVGHPTPAELDPENKFFTFEAGATKQSGGNGFADVWYKDHFAIEYKGPDGNLGKAYSQLLQYRESLENPPLLIVSNCQTISIRTNFTSCANVTVPITLDDLLTPQGLQRLRYIFYNPVAFRPEMTAAQVTEEAAARFGQLAAHLARWGYQPHDVAHYLIRLLFCLFAEDIDLLPVDLFTRVVENGRRNVSGFNRQVKLLLRAMAEGDSFGEHPIRYFDGGLFDDDAVLDMDSQGIAILHGITQLDWSAIEPAILGTLFVRSLDPSKRAQLGAHYTSKEDILLIVEPVLMAPLRREWEAIKPKARELAQQRNTAPTTAAKTRIKNELTGLVMSFAQKIRATRVLDAACGSANFLYISLRLLMDLEKEVSNFCGEVELQPFFPEVSPRQLYGIEINDYAHELAQATVWIGYLQWLHENGYGFAAEPILQPLHNIQHMDAILAYDEQGRPVEPEWPEAEVIVGNPPFLGDKKMRAELGGTYVEDLRKLYEGRVPGGADLVSFWYEKARAMMATGRARRTGPLATNSIRFGANRQVLDRVKQSGDIFMAWSDRPWIIEGAAVRVSIVGFDDGTEIDRILDGLPVSAINADLTSGVRITHAVKLEGNAGLTFLGMMKAGPFDITSEQASAMLQSPPNSNGRPNEDVVKPRLGAQDITGRSRGGWVIDFVDMPEKEAALYDLPFEYVHEVVKPIRDRSNDARMRTYWWLHGRSRPALRQAIRHLMRCIVTPEVAKHRIFVWMETTTVPDHTCHVIARSDDYFFGVLHSRLHELWSLAIGNFMGKGNDPRYNSSRTFETFPFPWPPGREPAGDPRVEAIAQAARLLVEQRDVWLNPVDASEAELKKRTLTNLYNQRPDWLDLAHRKLDAAVLDAYGWPHDLTDEEILERLLALNLARARGGDNSAQLAAG